MPLDVPFYAVAGNMDVGDSAGLPVKRIVELNGRRLGITHTYGPGDLSLQKALEAFRNEAVEVIVFGHSHRAMVERVGRILVMNPGSALHPRAGRPQTVGLLELSDRVTGRIIELSR